MAEVIDNQIRRWRFERGEMTQEDLARLVGVTRQTIIALEKGKYNPSLQLAFRLSRASPGILAMMPVGPESRLPQRSRMATRPCRHAQCSPEGRIQIATTMCIIMIGPGDRVPMGGKGAVRRLPVPPADIRG